MNDKLLWVITIVGLYVIFGIPVCLIIWILSGIVGFDFSFGIALVAHTIMFLIWVIKELISIL